MKNLGFCIATDTRHFMSVFSIEKRGSSHEVEAEFDGDIKRCLFVPKRKTALQALKVVSALDAQRRFYVLQVFKNGEDVRYRPISDGSPSWLNAQPVKAGGLLIA